MSVDSGFLGQGWAFPFSFSSSTGGVSVGTSITESEGVEHIAQSIQQILGTAIGSRVMQRDFGSGARDLLFDPNDPMIDVQLDYVIRSAITKWEPRVIVGPIVIDRTFKNEGRLDVQISYTIIKTNVQNNEVFPFYLSAADRTTYLAPAGT